MTRSTAAVPVPEGNAEAELTREDVSFLSGAERCEGWLYRPNGAGPHPCLIMAHGFGAIRAAGLPGFAQRFAQSGIAALVFDYRCLGTSEGEPRGLIDIARQRADYRAAVSYARTVDGVDPTRIALWGTSFSGGHVLSLTAEDAGLAAGVIMNPFVDGPPTVLATIRAAGLLNSAALGAKWLRDELRGLLRKDPYRVDLVGPPGSVAVFTTPDAVPGYQAILPENPEGWERAVPARILLRIATDRPGRRAPSVECPLLVSVCDRDLITPARPAVRVARRAPRGEVRRYPIGHFDLYAGSWHERVVNDQVAFLQRVLTSVPQAQLRQTASA